MLTKAGNLIRRFRSEGTASTLRLIHARSRAFVVSYLEDRRRGVSTSRVVKRLEPELRDKRCHWYLATDYETFDLAMQRVSVLPDDVFVDFGSGKGRIVILAGGHPFRKVIGIEFSRKLHDAAVQNVEAVRENLRCRDVELIHGDATQWELPAEVTTLFFFNPFEGEILAKVCDNIRQSLARAPRKLTIIYVRPEKFFEKEIDWQQWLEKKAEVGCLEGKVCIYESKATF